MSRQIVGLDIGESTVKLVCLGGGRGLKKAVSAQLPEGLVSGGEILSMDAMGDFLRQTAKEQGIPRGDAAIILPAAQVFVRSVSVPAMTAAQLNYNLPYEFKDYLTEDKSDYIFDYAVTGVTTQEPEEDAPEGTEATQELSLFACAALRKTIAQYRSMLKRAGFRLKYAVPGEYALSSLLRRQPQDRDYCIVDLGHQGSVIDIFHGSTHSQRRTIDTGLQDLDDLIARQMDVDVHIARTYKLSNYNDVLSSEAAQELYRTLAVEVMKAVNFYNYNNREAALEDLYLCGGGAALEGLTAEISEMTGLNVHPGAELLPGGGAGLESPWLYLSAWGCGLSE